MKERLITDTTDFVSIDYGDIIIIDQKRYKVTGHEHERRFGIDNPKFWVKKAVDLDSGDKKIIKLAYFESFETSLGEVKIRCFRSPDKEGEILDLVKDHPYFMKGTACRDIKCNNIRVLDVVHGRDFFSYIDSLNVDYETYFHTVLPGILKKLVRAFDAIRFLHFHRLNHGDVRTDHIIIDRVTEDYVWIDFDYDYEVSENPFCLDIFGLGNILAYAIGKGFHNVYMIDKDRATYGDLIDRLETRDLSIFDKGRLLNLKKLYPFIPNMLNDILLHFSRGTNVYYEYVEEIVEDSNRYLYSTS